MLRKLQNTDRAYNQRDVLLKLYSDHAISRHPLVIDHKRVAADSVILIVQPGVNEIQRVSSERDLVLC